MEHEIDETKALVLQSSQAAEQAKAAVAQNAQALQDKLAERQKLLSQLDQAKMQEQMNTAMASLGETVGEDVPGFDEIRDKIEARYAKAKGMAELTPRRSVDDRMLEIERAVDEHRGPGAAVRDPHPARPRPRRAEAGQLRRGLRRRDRATVATPAEQPTRPTPSRGPASRPRRIAIRLSTRRGRLRDRLRRVRLQAARRGRRGGRPRPATPSGRSALRRPATLAQAGRVERG